MTDEQIEKASAAYVLERQLTRHNAQKAEDATMSDFDKTRKAWDAYDMMQAFIDGTILALSHQWVSVKERLPEDGTMVTAHSPNGRTDVLKYHDGEFIDELGQAHCVDYFIPIPQLNPEKQSI